MTTTDDLKSDDLKTHIAAAVAVRFDDFAARHPALAGVIDQTLLVENVAATLSNDPDYQAALATARGVGAGLETIVGVIDRHVVKWIERLI